MQYYHISSSSIIQEQKFAELVQSIKHTKDNLYDEQNEDFYSLINENIQIKYELIQNEEASKLFNLQLLKISNLQFVKCHQCYFCVLFNLPQDTLKQRLKNEIMKYSFQTQFFDFTIDYLNNIDLSTELEDLDNYTNQNYRECRVIIFSQDFDQNLIDKVNGFPYIYFCNNPTNVNQTYLENLQQHQIFLTLDFQYKRILQLLPTSLSILNQQIYTNIQITGIVNHTKDENYQINHPSLKIEQRKSQLFFQYDIPFMNVDEYLYLPLFLSTQEIEISDIFYQNEIFSIVKQSKDLNDEIYDFIYKFKLLKQIYDQIKLSELEFSIIQKNQFFSIDQLIFRNQIKQLKEHQKESELRDDELHLIEKVLQDLFESNKPQFLKMIKYHQTKHCLLYRMKINNLIYQN